MGKNTFRKAERLSRKKWIQELFDKGSSFNLYPYRVLYMDHPEPPAGFNQVMFSVSTRLFKRAADRANGLETNPLRAEQVRCTCQACEAAVPPPSRR